MCSEMTRSMRCTAPSSRSTNCSDWLGSSGSSPAAEKLVEELARRREAPLTSREAESRATTALAMALTLQSGLRNTPSCAASASERQQRRR
ncbi:uncharacterized protein IUM83_09387 [Phytophthora cinnamomi]|uniref:uncharacterized protein n=1 Tax=Phytophthora cinnamomi TaxID=4785 RepID=UPI003559E025|nr:hypothetical protein IUM83_09387 [Phytophthora cinnamomi]